ncbi:hypothetical protein G6F35_017835 [Rhizopus arrhizus]|nr:hypothetical protein G6F35_017835 [Rhizopus arrhizus]
MRAATWATPVANAGKYRTGAPALASIRSVYTRCSASIHSLAGTFSSDSAKVPTSGDCPWASGPISCATRPAARRLPPPAIRARAQRSARATTATRCPGPAPAAANAGIATPGSAADDPGRPPPAGKPYGAAALPAP